MEDEEDEDDEWEDLGVAGNVAEQFLSGGDEGGLIGDYRNVRHKGTGEMRVIHRGTNNRRGNRKWTVRRLGCRST